MLDVFGTYSSVGVNLLRKTSICWQIQSRVLFSMILFWLFKWLSVELLNCWTVELLNCWTVELLHCWTAVVECKVAKWVLHLLELKCLYKCTRNVNFQNLSFPHFPWYLGFYLTKFKNFSVYLYLQVKGSPDISITSSY